MLDVCECLIFFVWRLFLTMHSSIHPSTHLCLSRVGSRWHQAQPGIPDHPLSSDASQLLLQVLKLFPGQMGYLIHPTSPGSTPGPRLVEDAWKISTFMRRWNHLHIACLTVVCISAQFEPAKTKLLTPPGRSEWPHSYSIIENKQTVQSSLVPFDQELL